MDAAIVSPDRPLTVHEAANLLGVSAATLRNWDRLGRVRARRHPINRYRVYLRHEIEALAAQAVLFPPDQTELVGPSAEARAVRRAVAQLHDILRDTDGQSNIVERFDELTKLLFVNVMTGRSSGDLTLAPPSPREPVHARFARLAKHHRDLFPPEFATLRCSEAAARRCLDVLDPLDLSAISLDFAGLAYEEVIRHTFDKSDNQQFFTPPAIVEFVVSLCEGDLAGDVCDPACGTGGFLAAVARRDPPYGSLTGMEIDARLRWAAGVNIAVHGGRNASTLLFSDGGTLGAGAEPYFGRFDTILTNPPFGSDLVAPELLRHFALGRDRPSRRRGILFVERCWHLLRPGGLLAMVIEDGLLNLPHAEDARRYVIDHFSVEAVISLPESAFQPYASVNASLLLLRKHDRSGDGA